MLGSLHTCCIGASCASYRKHFIKCQYSCRKFLESSKTWNQFFPWKLNGEISIVRNSILPLEGTTNTKKHILLPLCLSRYINIDDCINTKQCYKNAATYYPLTFTITNIYRESSYENVAQDILPNVFNSYTISHVTQTMSSAIDTNVSKTSEVVNYSDFGSTQNDCRTDDELIEQATKCKLCLGSQQNANQFGNVHTENKLVARLSCKIQSIKQNSKRRGRGMRKHKLMLLLAGACLSCKKSKKEDSFETTDAILNQEQFANVDIQGSSSKIEDANTNAFKSVLGIVKDLSTEKDAQSSTSVLISESNYKANPAVDDFDDNLDELLIDKTSDTEKKDEHFCEMDVDQQSELLSDFQIQNESVFEELPYTSCSTLDITCTDRNKKRKKRSHGNRVQKKKFYLKGEVSHTSTDEDSVQTKKRPNYFVAIQVSNPQIISVVKQVQNHILENEPKLKSALIKPATLHLTIVVCHITDDIELERASSALQASYDLLNKKLTEDPLYLTFEGLGNFQNKVLYAKLLENVTLNRLKAIAYQVKACYEQHDIDLTGSKALVPHLTLFKMSKDPKLWRKGIKKIEPPLYQAYNNVKFGVQRVEGLQLLSMLKSKDSNGYYYCEKEFLFHLNYNGETLKPNSSYKEELSTALRKEKEVIRKHISSLTYHQLRQPPTDKHKTDFHQDKCSNKETKSPAERK